MKKILAMLLVLMLTLSVFTSCGVVDGVVNQNGNGTTNQNGNPDSSDKETETPNYKLTDFTTDEKALFTRYIGELLPFIPTNEYYIEGYYDIDDFENGINYYAKGNTFKDFNDYRALYSDFDLFEIYEDDYGDTWYCYTKGQLVVDMSFYYHENESYIDVFVFRDSESENNGGGENNENTSGYTYTEFTSSDKEVFMSVVGMLVPFVPTNEYYVEEYYDEYYECYCVSYYTLGNTQADFNAYRALYSSYTLVDSFEDVDGDTWYCYEKGDLYLEMAFYYYDGDYVIDIYVYGADSGNEDNSDGESNDNTGSYTYTEFTSSDKEVFMSVVGALVPFVSTNEYYVEEYYDEYYGCNCVSYYTLGNTQADFNAYRALYSSYTLVDSFEDMYGDTWYCYEKGDLYLEMSFYYYDGDYVIDIYVYGADGSGDSGNGTGNNGSATQPDGLITNEGAGLPSSGNVHNVDFTISKYVKNVTEQGYYIDGCPTTGTPAVLVIPVEFSDAKASSKGYTISNIVKAFKGDSSEVDYYSVYDYYRISSNGQLNLDITVLDFWFCPKYTSSYYEKQTIDYYGDEIFGGDQIILNEALDYLDDFMDLSKFDSDGNDIIDSVVLINTLDIGDDDFYWAYRYWNVYTDKNGYYYEYDGVSANDYCWLAYSFMYESYDENGNASYDDTSVINTYTFIHEFGHVLGADDYYDTSGKSDPMGGCDIMDSMYGDHNAFTKFNFGWITASRLVTTSTSVTLTLNSFSETGDTIIIANNFDPELGAYQEYYIVVYYTMDGLNGGEYGYFTREGIIVYHVNASLYKEDYDGETYYDIYNNNTDSSDYYGTTDNLIEYVLSSEGSYTYVAGDSLPTVYDDLGSKLCYTFTVDSINGDEAVITFTKNK